LGTVSARDVLFDEETPDGTTSMELIAQLDELVAKVSLESSQRKMRKSWRRMKKSFPRSETGTRSLSILAKTKSCLSTKRKIMSLYVQLRGLDHPPPSEVISENDSAIAAYIPFQVVDGRTPGTSKDKIGDAQSDLAGLQEDGWNDGSQT
jgi:hypothetical protein